MNSIIGRRSKPNQEVRWIPNRELACTHPGRVGEVLYDLPINGYFSNLTAVFWIRQVKGGWALELFDLTVFGEGADKG